MICPNVNTQEWKNLVEAHGERGAYRKWLENGKEIPGVTNMSIGMIGKLAQDLQKNINIDVVLNPDMDVSGRVIKINGEARIEINPNLLQNDTIIHEFGHVYIDLLGGLSNPIIKAGIARLRGSNLEAEVKRNYPDLSAEAFDKELLATAIGREGYEIWKNNQEKASSISKWLTAFFRNLRNLIGIKEDVAKKLARDLLENRVAKEELVGDIESELYEQRSASTNSTVADKRKALAEKALGIITSKIEALKRKIDSSNVGQQLALAELITLQKSLQREKTEIALANFVKTADHQTRTILEKFTEYAKPGSNVKLSTIKYLRDSMRAFDPGLLEAISEDLTPEQKNMQTALDDISVAQGKVDRAFNKMAKRIVLEEINPDFAKITGLFIRRAEIEFNKKFRDLKGQEKKDKLAEYTRDYLERNEQAIEDAKQKKLDTFLTFIEKDISAFDALVNNPKDMNSDIIQELTHLFDKSDFEVQQFAMFLVKRAENLFEKYTQYVGKEGDQKKQWAPILEKNEAGETLPMIARKGSKEWKEIKGENGKYKGTAVEDMYDFMIESINERDNKLHPKFRLGHKLPSLNKNSFERMAENGVFTAIKEGTIDQFKLRKEDTDSGEINDSAQEVRSSLDDSVKVMSTQSGEERKVIPIHFRGKMEEKDRSYDVLSLVVIDAHQAEDFQSKRKLADTAEVMLELVGKADVYQRSGMLGKLKVTADGSPQLKEGQSNVYKALESVIENRLYGIKTTGDPRLAKMVSKVKSYVSIINLFGNYLSAGANFTQGLAMVFMEGAGSQFYTVKDVMTAEAKYIADTASNISDNVRRQDKGKTNLLREMFNATSSFELLENNFSKNSALKRGANIGSGLALNKLAEHSAQSIGMYAVLTNNKVLNKDGNLIDKNGNVVTERSAAMSLDEAYSVGYQNIKTKETISREKYDSLTESQKGGYIDGVLHLNENVAATERTPKGIDNFKISQMLRRVNRDLFGSYDPKNRSQLERHAIGSLFTHMRGWMMPGIKKRWKGGETMWIRDKNATLGFRALKNDEFRDVDLHFNKETEQFEEGMYVTTIRYLTSLVQDANKLKFKVLSENWKDLTQAEKNNIRRTATEIALMVAAYLVFVALSAALEDDDDEMTMLITFYSRRLLSELMSYVSPAEWHRTFRSPAVTLSLLETTIKAMIQTASSPMEEYERGRHKGENKALVQWMKLTPLKAFDKDVESSLQFLTRGY